MKKSTARKALESALAEATTPELRADIAAKLGVLLDREGRERARRQRQKRNNAKEAPKPTTKPYDGDEPFELDSYPPHVAAIPPKPDSLAEQRARVESEQQKAADAGEEAPGFDGDESASKLPAPSRDGWTRVIGAMEPPGVWDYEHGKYVASINPYSSVGLHPGDIWNPFAEATECIASNAYCNADGWSFEIRDEKTGEIRTVTSRERAEERKQQRLDDEFIEKWGW